MVNNEDLIEYFERYSHIKNCDLHCHLVLSFDKLHKLLSTRIRCL